nr:Transposon Ty3-G Gag-Pol polyprotein [Ipomoea batatas]
MKTNQLLGTWEDFMDKIKLRFGPSQLVDYQGQLSKLTQTSAVADYRASFERLLNKVSGIYEPVLISMFIAGLKHELQQDLLLAKPTSLEEAFSLAKTYESKYELLLSTPKWASRPTVVSIPHRPYSNHQPPIRPTIVTMPQPPQHPSPTATTGRPIPDLPVRRLSAAEIRDKRSKGLCYNCDKKWSNSHRCQSRFLMLLGMEEDDQVCQEEVTPQDDQFTGAVLITTDISTLNSLSGMNTPRSLRLWGDIHGQKIQILVDGGSTHNFIQPSVAEKLHLTTTTIEKFNVYIGNGDSLHCRVRCPQVPIQMQGTIFPIDLFVLPIQGPDVVVGVQWLQQLGKITHDYAQLSMDFLWNGQPICLKGDHARSLQQITFNQLQAITESKNVEELYELFYIASTENEELPDTTLSMEFELPQGIPNEAAELILSFSTIFQPPRDLPPHRDLDHKIHLLPGSKPVNVRPYRYPHFQKSEIEKLVKDMLQQGLIRPSQNALSRVPESEIQLFQGAFYNLISISKVQLLDTIREDNMRQPDLLKLHQRISQGETIQHVSVNDGILLFKNHYFISTNSQLKPILLQEFHTTPMAGHEGAACTFARLAATFYWQKMKNDVDKFVTSCLVC